MQASMEIIRGHETPGFTILYDALQEAEWFCSLHSDLADAKLVSINNAPDTDAVRGVLAYDRPDIVLLDGGKPILVVEQTSEVPSGHNPGQRFARIVASAEAGVPVLYFVPYAAKKHGGETAGPRYMNVRVFRAVDALTQMTGSVVTTVNWPVDKNYEVLLGPGKDRDTREYMETFLALHAEVQDVGALTQKVLESEIHRRMIVERDDFVRDEIRSARRYDTPPGSVRILNPSDFALRHELTGGEFGDVDRVVVYRAGMQRMRSDPYTGMALAYRYLYVLSEDSRVLVLWFPKIKKEVWERAKRGRGGKSVRVYTAAADAILFADGLVFRKDL